MFESIRYRLLFSYLGVLAVVLFVFSVAVRTVFIHNLRRNFIAELELLANAAAAANLSDGIAATRLRGRNQAIQWFDVQGIPIGHTGGAILTLPIKLEQPVQVQILPRRKRGLKSKSEKIVAVTVPRIDSQFRYVKGFVRASQSYNSTESAIRRLDWGLGSGITLALMVSGLGGIWLTRQSMMPIEESFDCLKQFTADASHELRSPLTAIISNGQVALKYPEGIRPSDAEKFEAIISASSQMKQLTEDLLFLSRTDRLPQQTKGSIDLSELLQNLVQLYQSEADAKQIDLTLQVEPELIVLGDNAHLNRLFTNLLVNALQYTPQSGAVTVKARHGGKMIWVRIEDTGIGIPADQLSKVFDRFWRASRSRNYRSGGSGLGLSIAKAIVLNHGGHIHVDSKEDVGTCFQVSLPAASSPSKSFVRRATMRKPSPSLWRGEGSG